MDSILHWLIAGAAIVGHACFWTAILNDVYGRALPKPLLKIWRLTTGANIAGFTLVALLWLCGAFAAPAILEYYTLFLCLPMALIIFPFFQIRLWLRPRPKAKLTETNRVIDYWLTLRHTAIGDGHYAWCPRLPLNCVFQVEFTELTLRIPKLPLALHGLELLFLSDLHFHGTPSWAFWNTLFDELAKQPTPDIIAIGGDFVDSNTHHEWIVPLLNRLKYKEHGVAVLGNHDWHHHPEQVRAAIRQAGFLDLGNRWQEVTIRGERCILVGHEGPWFTPSPDLSLAPEADFRLCISHTPDNFPWATRHGCTLTLSGHVHGGGIRVPIFGPIFIPSIYGRRYDQGVFENGGGVLVVSRGLSGKEPIRFRCFPQVIRMKLVE